MNQLLSLLCAFIAVAVVAGTAFYGAYCAFVAVFGEGESGHALLITICVVLGFFGLMAAAARVNAR